MPKQCSICGETYDSRGFGSHNEHMHDGEATGEPIEPDDADDADADADGDAGTVEQSDVVDDDPDDNDPDDVELSDADDDPKEYHCNNCGTAVEYLEKTCPDCGEKFLWSKIE